MTLDSSATLLPASQLRGRGIADTTARESGWDEGVQITGDRDIALEKSTGSEHDNIQ